MNARFNVVGRDGGVVTLTLQPGQAIKHHFSSADDEGFSYHHETWEFDGEAVLNQILSGGRDCEGRIDHSATFICPLDQLKGYTNSYGELFPLWKEVSDEVYDQFARAAGY